MLTSDWNTLLCKARSEYRDYMQILAERREGDSRVAPLWESGKHDTIQ